MGYPLETYCKGRLNPLHYAPLQRAQRRTRRRARLRKKGKEGERKEPHKGGGWQEQNRESDHRPRKVDEEVENTRRAKRVLV